MAPPARLRTVVIDCADPVELAEFYRRVLGGSVRPEADDWVVLDVAPGDVLAFQRADDHLAPTWPMNVRPQQLHLDLTVPGRAELDEQHDRVLALGGRLLLDRSDDPEEPLRVYADLAGHPFCIFVA